MNSYQWLLFDADNTLFDFDTAEDHALTRTLLHFQIPAEPPVKKCYHAINDGLWKDFENGKISREALAVRRFVLLMDALKVQGEAEEWNRYYMNALSQCAALIPGAEALCRRAAQKYTLALITNGAPDIQRKRLNNSPIAQYFGDRVFISEEMGCRKPEKIYFEKVLDALGARNQKGKVLVIGDSLTSDIRGAFNSQLDSVWIHWPSDKPGAIKPTYEVENLAQLTEFLNAHRLLPMKPY